MKQALSKVEVFRLTVGDVQGLGRQKGHTEVYRGHEYEVNLIRKVKLEIAVNDEVVEPTIETLIQGGKTGPEGKIGSASSSSMRARNRLGIPTETSGEPD